MSTSILSFLLLSFTVIQSATPIPWNAARKLTWEDFKGAPDPRSSNAALTSSNIHIEFTYDDTGLEYSIKCTFDKTRSWVRIRSNDILTHEQGHFDIAEIYARRLNKALKEYRFNANTVSRDVNSLYDNIMDQHRQAQTQYDQATDHSRNRPGQEEWLKKITADLKTLEAFANYNR